MPVPRSALASVGTAESEHDRLAEGWSLVERIRGGNGACSSSLSYVIMQMEQPSLVEGYFAGAASAAEGEPAHPRPEEAPSAPGGLIAHCMSRLDVPW